MKKAECIARQGDVLFYKLNDFPEGERIVDHQCKSGALAYGEVTGRAHEISDSTAADAFKILNNLYLNVKKPAAIRHGRQTGWIGTEPDHDYHNEITLPVGKYFIGITQETDHIEKISRKVID